jgi:hypothetical protein
MPLDRDRKQFWYQLNIHQLVREGYRNVIVQDPNLEGASADVIRKRHIQWVKDRGFHLLLGIPRFDYYLFLDDRTVRSILSSSEPNTSSLVGYVNVTTVILIRMTLRMRVPSTMMDRLGFS